MTGFSQVPTFLHAHAAALTQAATRQGGTKNRENLLRLSVCISLTGEERDELMRGVTPVNVEGEKTAVLAVGVNGKALKLSLVIVPGAAVVM